MVSGSIVQREKMRRTIWNLYAWPITLLSVISFFSPGEMSFYLITIDTLMNILALVVLHLHIWDRKFFHIPFWKVFSFAFIIWDFGCNIILRPLDTGKPFDPGLLIVPVILLPLYISLFRYGFRKWDIYKDPDETEDFIFLREKS